MFIEFTTTITHKIEFGDEGIIGVSHSTDIGPVGLEAVDLGHHVIMTIVGAGCKATLKAIAKGDETETEESD